MSRYTIFPKNPIKYGCVVGYDNPLQTYFAQVTDIEAEIYNKELSLDSNHPEKQEFIVCNGQTPKEIESIEKLELTIKDYAEIPPYIKDKLNKDKNDSKGPNNFQKSMIELAEGIRRAKSDSKRLY